LAFCLSSGMAKGDIRSSKMEFLPFLAVRPMSTTKFLSVKIRHTALVALVACALGMLVVLSCMGWQANRELVGQQWRTVLDVLSPPKTWVLALLFPGLLILVTWQNFVQNLWVGLGGRTWLNYVV